MIALLLALAACAEPEAGGDSAEPAAGDPACDDAPVTTWDNFGAGFVTENCQACHASAAPDRHGAPADVVFDTEEDLLRVADRVLARVTSDPPTMPPQGGVTDDDRYRVGVWLGCDAP